MRQVDQGQTVKLTATFRDFAGALYDPTTVKFSIFHEADGTEETHEYVTPMASVDDDINRVSTGIYYLYVSTSDVSGVYTHRVSTTGTTPTSKQGQFYVKPDETGDLNMGAWTVEIRKATDQTVTNSATLTDDSTLQRAVVANETWLVELDILYSGDDSDADFKWGWALSAGTATGHDAYVQRSNSVPAAIESDIRALDAAAASVTTAAPTGSAHTDVKVLQVTAMLRFSADGIFKFQFAQNVQTGGKSVKVRTGSRLRIKKLT